MSRPSYDAEALRRRGRELAAAAPPLTPEQREQIRAILRGCAPAPHNTAAGPAPPGPAATPNDPLPAKESSRAESSPAA
jgi:hypothetical protein